MCAVIYTSIIPTRFHADIMKILESPEGQSEREFGLILNRRMSTEGVNLLQAIAQEGYLKKAPTNQVIVKPNASSAIRLDELNSLLKMAGDGEEAISKLEKLERESGFKDSRKNPQSPTPAQAAANLMDDATLSQNYLSQSTRMRAEAKTLLAEADRLESEAAKLNPQKKVAKRGRNTKVVA
jgi:hypothetical protein